MTDLYQICTLTAQETPVRFVLGGGAEVTGRMIRRRGVLVYEALRDDGKYYELPDHAQPSLWRPLDASAWPHELPEPATLSKSGLFTAATRSKRWGSLLATAPPTAGKTPMLEQEEAAAVIRAEAAAAVGIEPEDVAIPRHLLPPSPASSQFWLTEPVTYSPPGEISPREAEARVSRAILTDGLRAMETPGVMIDSTQSALSEFIHSSMTSEDGAHLYFEPTGRDQDDFLTAFAWFTALNPPELWHKRRQSFELCQSQDLLVWRALLPPLSWRQIAKKINRSPEGARRLFGAALDGVWRAANGKQVLQFVPVKDQLAALRARNRAAQR